MNVSTLYGLNITSAKTSHNLAQTENQVKQEGRSLGIIRPEQWGEWKSFGKLLNDAVIEIGWQERYSVLRGLVKEFGVLKPGYLTKDEFLTILNNYPVTEKEYGSVFYNLLDRNQDGIMSEVEFTSGMLSLSPLASNNATSSIGQLRLQFIFLYYDSDRNGLLNLNELKKILLHISAIRSLANDTKKMSESKAREYAIHLIAHYDGIFGFNAFYQSVKNNILKGTSWLLRTQKDLVDMVTYSDTTTSLNNYAPYSPLRDDNTLVDFKNNDIKLNKSQLISETYVEQEPNHTDKLNENSIFNVTRTKDSVENKVIDFYMEFILNMNKDIKSIDDAYINNILTANDIIYLCSTIVQILRDENSLIIKKDFKMPVRVYGDIHGQLIDLLHFFENFSWPHFRCGDILSMNYVFLGDYVDRGKFSLEVVCLLFSLKILFPNRITLLRGHHEDPLMNLTYGFHTECIKLYGENDGHFIWERINDVFEFLSLACVIEDQILCLHGGIGKTIKSLDDLRDIEKPIHVTSDVINNGNQIEYNYNRYDQIVIDCLWSDPIQNDSNYVSGYMDYNNNNSSDYDDNLTNLSDSKKDINVNNFNYNDIEKFFENTNIQLIVRGHECVQNGYEYNYDGKLLTLFTATHYCNSYKNDAAVCVFTRDPNNDDILHFNQILKYQSFDNSLGWIDHSGDQNKEHNSNYKDISNYNTMNNDVINSGNKYNKGSIINKLLTSSNASYQNSNKNKSIQNSNKYVFPSPSKVETSIINKDFPAITPSKTKYLSEKGINLTATFNKN